VPRDCPLSLSLSEVDPAFFLPLEGGGLRWG